MNADNRFMAKRNARRAQTGERGTALIEIALVFPLLLVLTVAAVDFGRAFFAKNIVEQAAREGVRMRAVTTVADSGLVRARVQNVLEPSHVTLTGLSITGPDASNQDVVTVTTEFNWIFPGVFNLFGAGFTNPTTLTGHAVMRNEG